MSVLYDGVSEVTSMMSYGIGAKFEFQLNHRIICKIKSESFRCVRTATDDGPQIISQICGNLSFFSPTCPIMDVKVYLPPRKSCEISPTVPQYFSLFPVTTWYSLHFDSILNLGTHSSLPSTPIIQCSLLIFWWPNFFEFRKQSLH